MKTCASSDLVLALLAFDLSSPIELSNECSHPEENGAQSSHMMDLRDLRRRYAGGLQPL